MTRFTNTLGMSYNSRLLSGALINGKWLPGSAGTFTVNDPHTGTALHEVGRASPTDVDRAVQAAKAAFPAWAATSVQSRAKILRKVQSLYEGQGRGSTLESAQGTAWGLLNAVTEYVDHERRARSTEYRMDSAWFGQGAVIKQRALQAALELAA